MELAEAIASADVVIGAELRAEELARAKRLRLVQVLGAGYDGIATDALPAECALCNVFLHEIAIAEWALMAMLALTRRLLPYDRDLRRGTWHDAHRFEGTPPRDLRGSALGAVGLGTIGSETVRLARALGMTTMGITRTPTTERERDLGLQWIGRMADLERLCREADFLLIAVPLAPDTRGLIGREELEFLGTDGYLINVCRGPVVEEEALYTALASGSIAGAGLDVWYRYPTAQARSSSPRHFRSGKLKNVVMTPHLSGFAESTFTRRWVFIAKQIQRLQRGEPFRNVVQIGGS